MKCKHIDITYEGAKRIELVVLETIMETFEEIGITKGSTLWHIKYSEARDKFMDKLDKKVWIKKK